MVTEKISSSLSLFLSYYQETLPVIETLYLGFIFAYKFHHVYLKIYFFLLICEKNAILESETIAMCHSCSISRPTEANGIGRILQLYTM